MGLSLYWELRAGDGVDPRAAVSEMRSAALSAGFAEVGEVIDVSVTVHPAGEEATADRAWALSQAMVTLHPPGEEAVRLVPRSAVLFRATNPGAEDAVFGLADYEGLGWRFSGGCKTQGASKRGGMQAFLRSHRAIVTVLDRARSAGLKVSVKDDGEYWDTRDQKRLLDKLEEWEGLLASLGRRAEANPACTLAADVRDKIEAARKSQRRLDRAVVEGLEG